MSISSSTVDRRRLEPGMVLVNAAGEIRIIRSRTRDDTGWNCADGASVSDVEANDTERWTPYTPTELAGALELARELRAMAGHREFSGGLATWDACSGRPCALPRLAKIVN